MTDLISDDLHDQSNSKMYKLWAPGDLLLTNGSGAIARKPSGGGGTNPLPAEVGWLTIISCQMLQIQRVFRYQGIRKLRATRLLIERMLLFDFRR